MQTLVFAQPYQTGMNFSNEKYDQAPTKVVLLSRAYGNSLPANASLKDFSPYPLSQGQYGTCVGWSTAYAARTIAYAKQNGITDRQTITQNAFSPGYVYSHIKSSTDETCQWGAYIDDAMQLLIDKGVPLYSDLNENCPTYISPSVYSKAESFKIQDYAKLFEMSDENNFKIQAVKKSLAEGKPVVIGMNVPNSFYYCKGVWNPTEDYTQSYGGHAMCVIGYDNSMYGGAFEIQNSWGDQWGNDGYIWVRYSDFANFTKYAYELIEIPGSVPGKVDLGGTLRLVENNGSEMKATLSGNVYKMNKSYRSGTRFRIYISNNQPAFVYAIGSDQTNKVFQVFPHKPGLSPALTYSSNEVAIPDEDHYIQMDNTVGTDVLCVLYSKELLNIEQINASIESQKSGTFVQKVNNALAGKVLDPADITFNSDGTIGFNAKSNNKSVAVIVLETQHIK